jgi:GNAT superfamily N-acetyltransferase
MVLLDERHAAAMETLALATRPGPWRAGTHLYGDYYGLFEGDRLVAMAGERSRPGQGWAEVSGVCTDPAFRGRGLAARLIGRVLAGFAERGDAGFSTAGPAMPRPSAFTSSWASHPPPAGGQRAGAGLGSRAWRSPKLTPPTS